MKDTGIVAFDRAQKLLIEVLVHVKKHVERNCDRIVRVSEGCCFGSGGAYRDDGCRSGIASEYNRCLKERCLDSGVEGESQVP